jgi:RTX calcium-binding nonapeptide repeat (4 copies)
MFDHDNCKSSLGKWIAFCVLNFHPHEVMLMPEFLIVPKKFLIVLALHDFYLLDEPESGKAREMLGIGHALQKLGCEGDIAQSEVDHLKNLAPRQYEEALGLIAELEFSKIDDSGIHQGFSEENLVKFAAETGRTILAVSASRLKKVAASLELVDPPPILSADEARQLLGKLSSANNWLTNGFQPANSAFKFDFLGTRLNHYLSIFHPLLLIMLIWLQLKAGEDPLQQFSFDPPDDNPGGSGFNIPKRPYLPSGDFGGVESVDFDVDPDYPGHLNPGGFLSHRRIDLPENQSLLRFPDIYTEPIMVAYNNGTTEQPPALNVSTTLLNSVSSPLQLVISGLPLVREAGTAQLLPIVVSNFTPIGIKASELIAVSLDVLATPIAIEASNVLILQDAISNSIDVPKVSNHVNAVENAIQEIVQNSQQILQQSTIDRLTGNQTITVSGKDLLVVNSFGGVGRGAQPSPEIIAEVDTIRLNGEDLIAKNMILTQNGSDLVITFEGANQTQLTLRNFSLENLDNLALATGSSFQIGNILFNGDTQIQDSFDVINADAILHQVLRRNTVTFLNDSDNQVSGYDASDDVINGQGGNDILLGLGGNDILRGGVGDDILLGGAGLNMLTGNSGSDTFVLSLEGISYVTDFTLGQDRIALQDGIRAEQITIEQGTGINSSSTWVKYQNVTVMSLSGVQANALTTDMFVSASDYLAIQRSPF